MNMRCMNSPHPSSSRLVARSLAYALLPVVGLSCVLQASWFAGNAAAEPTPVTTPIPASDAFISVAKAAQPAVVNISSSRKFQLAFTHIKSFCKALARGVYAVC
jgi:hypothetical protein